MHVHDCLCYFQDTSMYEDITAVTQKPDCKFRKYEIVHLLWLKHELNAAMSRWDEDKIDEDDVVLLEVGESSEDDGSYSENDKILQPRNSRSLEGHVQHI